MTIVFFCCPWQRMGRSLTVWTAWGWWHATPYEYITKRRWISCLTSDWTDISNGLILIHAWELEYSYLFCLNWMWSTVLHWWYGAQYACWYYTQTHLDFLCGKIEWQEVQNPLELWFSNSSSITLYLYVGIEGTYYTGHDGCKEICPLEVKFDKRDTTYAYYTQSHLEMEVKSRSKQDCRASDKCLRKSQTLKPNQESSYSKHCLKGCKNAHNQQISWSVAIFWVN